MVISTRFLSGKFVIKLADCQVDNCIVLLCFCWLIMLCCHMA